MKKIKLSVIFTIFSIIPALAESDLYSNNEEIKEILNKGAYEPSYIMMFVGLFLVIALVYFTGIVYQKLIKVKISNNETDEKNKAEIVSVLNLGQNKNLYVIKINNEYSLLGATQNNITLLKEIKQEGIYEKNG